MNEEQISYVVEQFQAGYDRTAVRQALESAGYDAATIDELFTAADTQLQATKPVPSAPEPAASESTLSTPTHSKTRAWILFVLVAVGVFAIGGVVLAGMLGYLKIPGLSSLFGGAPYNEDSILQEMQIGFSKIDSAAFTASLTIMGAPEKDPDVYLPPPELQGDFTEDLATMMLMLPQDFTLRGEVSGNFDLSEEEMADTYARVAGEYSTDDFSVFADVEFILAAQDGMFLRVNRMPSLFMLDLSPIKGDWVHVIDRPLDDVFKEAMEEDLAPNSEDAEQYAYIGEQAHKYQVYTVAGEPEQETLNGEDAYKYTFKFNQSELRTYLEETVRGLESTYGSDHVWADNELLENIDTITDPVFIDYINTHVNVVVWARSDGIPVRFGIVGRIPVDDDFSPPQRSALNDMLKQMSLNNQRVMAEVYYSQQQDSYAGFCTSAGFNNFREQNTEWEIDCNDTSDAYAIEVMLDDSSYCIDAEGYSEEGSILLVGDTRCDSSTKSNRVAETVTPEADRQVNISFMIDLTKINEPIDVEIPTDALSLEQAADEVPLLREVVDSMERSKMREVDSDRRRNLMNARAEAELYYDDNGRSYSGFCRSADMWELMDGHEFGCSDSDDAYAAEIELSNGFYCIDSTGQARSAGFSLINGTECINPYARPATSEQSSGGGSSAPTVRGISTDEHSLFHNRWFQSIGEVVEELNAF